VRRWREPAAIAAEIERIRSLQLDALRRHWRLVFGRAAPSGLSKDLLGRMIAARLQERAFGSLDRDSLRFLQSLARQERLPRRQLKTGTVLVREYHGRRHTVTTVRDGFEWQGTTYSSLSAIARAITGTSWSGPRFFAVQRAGEPVLFSSMWILPISSRQRSLSEHRSGWRTFAPTSPRSLPVNIP
jgi:Protein of unknown function (DUF2924)